MDFLSPFVPSHTHPAPLPSRERGEIPRCGWFETLPLQFWGGLTLEEALAASEEAILSHIEVLLMDGESVPKQGPLDEHQANADYAGGVWALVDAVSIV